MNKLKVCTYLLIVLLMAACSGSETYRGDWNAMDRNGQQCNIKFEAEKFTVTNVEGETNVFAYSQNSVEISNSIKTYGINLEDGRQYELNFPFANDTSIALIKDGNGVLLYTIGRNKYVEYDDIYKLD